jgi:hypothetical protein
MVPFQKWLVSTFAKATVVSRFMHGAWEWPMAESLHFIGLSLIVGTIVLFDLRLLGIGKRIPIRVWHRLIPFGLIGYGINLSTGLLFLMTEPDQYIYNPSFQFKLLFMGAAGINALLFYLTSYARTTMPGAPADAPRTAKIIGAISLCMWLGVIVAGRLLTFYRPYPCESDPGVLAQCIPDYYGRR